MTALFVVLIIMMILIMIECVRETHTFRVTHYEIESAKLKEIQPRKIILLSDLHNCEYGRKNDRLIRTVRNEKPDLILIAGDMLVGKPDVSAQAAIDFMKCLPQICEVCFANGNHEQRMKEFPDIYGEVFEKYREELIKNGIHYLENEKAEVDLGGVMADIIGLEIPLRCYRKFQKINFSVEEMNALVGKENAQKYQIVIGHNPLFAETYVKWGADLVVSGHLHGGIARIPFWRGVISPQGRLFPRFSGEMTRLGDSMVVVSKGLGIHTVPLRFLNPAEIVVLHFGKKERENYIRKNYSKKNHNK